MGDLSAHIGDLILWSFCVLALIAYTLTVMTGNADQTLGNVLMTGLGALGGYMVKKFTASASTTTNIDSANINKIATAPTLPTEEEKKETDD